MLIITTRKGGIIINYLLGSRAKSYELLVSGDVFVPKIPRPKAGQSLD
jgi:hypothetical protein